MKFLTFAILLLPFLSYSQSKDFAYGKLAASVLFQKEQDITFSGMAAIGARIDRYYTVGAGFGYFKPKDFDRPVIPVGLDFNLTDFGRKGISPVITGGLYYPIYKEKRGLAELKGQFMYIIGGGFALSSSKKQKATFTVNYSQLSVSTKSLTGLGDKSSSSINMIFGTVAFIL